MSALSPGDGQTFNTELVVNFLLKTFAKPTVGIFQTSYSELFLSMNFQLVALPKDIYIPSNTCESHELCIYRKTDKNPPEVKILRNLSKDCVTF
jgi:hypothetical protein